MTATPPSIVHETEAQRQHVRIPLPVKVEIAGTTLSAADWSNGGLGLQLENGAMMPVQFRQGSKMDATIVFPFEGFGMSLPVALEVTHIDLNKGRVGCRFDNLNRQQQSVIQYFVSAYISGEIIRVNDIMNIVSRNNFTRARNIPDAFAGMSAAEITRHKIKNAMRTGILATIALLLAGYVCMSVYERLFIVRASSASVTAEMLTVDAPVGGKVYFNPIAPDTMVKQGQPLLTVSVPTGNIIAVDSPCDCIVKRRLFENNSVARKADPLLELVRPDAVATVESSIAIEDAVKLSVGDEALLYLPGGNHRIRGEITSIQAGHATKGSSAVMIKPSTAIPAAFIDDPVEVHVDTLNLF